MPRITVRQGLGGDRLGDVVVYRLTSGRDVVYCSSPEVADRFVAQGWRLLVQIRRAASRIAGPARKRRRSRRS